MLCDFCTKKTNVTYEAQQANVCFICYKKWLMRNVKKEHNPLKELFVKQGDEFPEYQQVTERQYGDFLINNNKKPVIGHLED
ncbi:MAG: hypothetical protein AABY22_19035 [Nanoarchaeota archaeon]